jgi:hypothetical protein
MIPFKQEKIGNNIVRTFSDQMDQEDYYWHKDRDDRIVTILSCGPGWEYQEDDNIPIKLVKGLIFKIPKETWHRVIKGSGDLVINIEV